MNFLASLLILLVIYVILLFCAMNIKRVFRYDKEFPWFKSVFKFGIDDDVVPGVAGAYLFCVCYHFFIAVVTIGSASFCAYFIPCLIIAIIYMLSIAYEQYKEK